MSERDPPGEVLVDEDGNLVTLQAAVVDAVRQADRITGKPVTADVGALPRRIGADLLAERLEEWAAVARTARIVLPVGAGQEERIVHLTCVGPGIDAA